MIRVVLLALSVSGAVAAQTLPPIARAGVISGQVVDAGSGRPVSAVVVSISGPSIPLRVAPGMQPGMIGGGVSSSTPGVLTGADGRFAFRELPAGSYGISARKGGYAEGAYGRRRPGGASQSVILSDTRTPADVVVRVWKNVTIAGTVTDEAGEPVVGVQLRALERTLMGGRPRFVPMGPSAMTDDRGMYRFSSLLPGEYLVVASPPPVGARLSSLTASGSIRLSSNACCRLPHP